jgi:hypothetical protein
VEETSSGSEHTDIGIEISYTPRQNCGAFEDSEVPEEEALKENKENSQEVLNLYKKPEKRPLYSLQVECLRVISENLYPDSEDSPFLEETGEIIINQEGRTQVWTCTLLRNQFPIPIGFNLQPYNHLEIEQYIANRYKEWIKAGGLALYNQRYGWFASRSRGPSFYIDLWKVIDNKEIRTLDWYK